MRWHTLVFTTLAVVCSVAVWLCWERLETIIMGTDGSTNDTPHYTPDPDTYAVLSKEMHYHRKKLARRYLAARTKEERDAVLASTRNFLELTMPELMRCWLGTPWDFNGTASVPGKGKVACGYYVSSVMKNAGFDVQRIRLAQQPSQNILRTFLPRGELDIKSGTEYHDYMESLRHKEHGIYIIGLDRHVGFLVHNADGLRFIHSGGVHKQVVTETEESARSIRESSYRVTGNLTANKELLTQWLLNKPFKTRL